MNNEQLKCAMDKLARDLAADDIDLWPTIQERFRVSHKPSHKGVLSMNTKPTAKRALRITAASLLTLSILALLLLLTPQGKVWAQQILRFFTRSESDTIAVPTSQSQALVWVEPNQGVPAATSTPLPGLGFSDECGSFPDLYCTIEMIREKVDFPVKELGFIPETMGFRGATGSPELIYIYYTTPNLDANLVLSERPKNENSAQTEWNIGASAVVENVEIGNETGEYVKGSFGYHAGDSQAVWDSEADTQVVRWMDDHVFFELQYSGTQLGREDLIALAKSLTSEPITAGITPVAEMNPATSALDGLYEQYPLDAAKAEEMAGFILVQPSKLPEILSLLGANFDADQKVVSLFYLSDKGYTDGLLLRGRIRRHKFEQLYHRRKHRN